MSADKAYSDALAQHLQPVYQYLSHQYTKGIHIPESLPTDIRRDFYESLETYDRTISASRVKAPATPVWPNMGRCLPLPSCFPASP